MKKIILILFIIHLDLNAQQTNLYPLYSNNNDHTIYTGMQRIIQGNVAPSYIAAMALTKAQPATIDSTEGNSGYLFEANVNLNYTLMQGRNTANLWNQKNKVTLVFNPLFRMLKNVSSSPIIPGNY